MAAVRKFSTFTSGFYVIMIRTGETICAPATGEGGSIAIIRVSGPDSIKISAKIFFPADRGKKLAGLKGNSVTYGEIRDGADVVDDVMVSLYRAPHSYTGEDCVEISCHASAFIQRRIMELLISNGAITALPGEFTQRAFLNGKMDLSQAEAVADIISSSSEAAHRLAVRQIKGEYSAEIARLRKELLHFASLVELELDFGEEDVQFADRNDLLMIVNKVRDITDKLTSSFSLGNVIKKGVPVVITGKPNSGKSTLLNTLLMEDRAIVSDIPGTTRDAIEDTIVIGGIEYRFIDTAGLRDTTDIIENMGIMKTHEKIMQASVILMVDEIYDTPEAINTRAENVRKIIRDRNKLMVIVINKSDKGDINSRISLERNISVGEGESLIFISAKEKTGLDELRSILSGFVEKQRQDSGNIIVTNARHYEALSKTSESLGRVVEGLSSGIPEDLIAIDIRQAIHYLGEITGEISTDEILGNIFRNFCIGK